MKRPIVWSMGTYFSPPQTAPQFAASMLRQNQADIARRLGSQGFVQAELMPVLSVVLGDPAAPADAPIQAIVQRGRWTARCECGGGEFVDLTTLVTMCCSCWNLTYEHQFRRVVMPENRVEIEQALARRPEENRGWIPGETLEDLRKEDEAHGLV